MGTNHPHDHSAAAASLNRSAFAATWHCLTGCAIGEVLGLVIATALGWGNAAQIALAIGLAYMFGFGLTSIPLVRAELRPRAIDLIARGRGHVVVHGYR